MQRPKIDTRGRTVGSPRCHPIRIGDLGGSGSGSSDWARAAGFGFLLPGGPGSASLVSADSSSAGSSACWNCARRVW
eukprot:6573071-Pyramimonas_sp.AAC.1